METKRISPAEAKALLDEGYVYVDVRSIPEFDAGHPRGAYNVPLNHQGPNGMQPNPDFLAVTGVTAAGAPSRFGPFGGTALGGIAAA